MDHSAMAEGHPTTWSETSIRNPSVHDVRAQSTDSSARDGFTSKMGIDATKPLGADPAMFDIASS